MMGKAWNYDGSIFKWPIKPGEQWSCQYGTVMVNDLYTGLPRFMLEADCIFVDPPWSLGNENAFRTKAQIADRSLSYDGFLDALFGAIDQIGPPTCFMEMGRRHLTDVQRRMQERFDRVETFPATYYKRHPCFMLRGGTTPSAYDYSGQDEIDIIARVCREEPYTCIGDLCMGRGEVGVEAFRNQRRFVGVELNPARLAVMINRVHEIGGVWSHT